MKYNCYKYIKSRQTPLELFISVTLDSKPFQCIVQGSPIGSQLRVLPKSYYRKLSRDIIFITLTVTLTLMRTPNPTPTLTMTLI